ncbi:Transmembrane protease serine 11E [Entomophthora muscae]|uniref:Transmembrane protease serine 11E n=1 Tax=Entomophthora muscae TaxID=34485 RepID=A0ACC2T2S4_9FUNG|nr:Transmembrane protease serine 11E [Entomophthora muscae]
MKFFIVALSASVLSKLVPANQHPWVVSVQHDCNHVCTGLHVKSTYFIAPASCMKEEKMSILHTKRRVPVQQIVIHPRFNTKHHNHYDVAVLATQEPIAAHTNITFVSDGWTRDHKLLFCILAWNPRNRGAFGQMYQPTLISSFGASQGKRLSNYSKTHFVVKTPEYHFGSPLFLDFQHNSLLGIAFQKKSENQVSFTRTKTILTFFLKTLATNFNASYQDLL